MRSYILVIFLMSVAQMNHAAVSELGNLNKKEKKLMKQVKIEKGGLIILNQYLEQEKSISIGDRLGLSYMCEKKRKKLVCRAYEIKPYKKQESR